MSFDVIVPVGPNDIAIFEKQIEYTKKNIIGYRNIYAIVSKNVYNRTDCIFIDESIFPFSLEDVSKIHGKNSRNGWYLQQLLKLYAGFVIPDILERYLVIDCDTFFLKPTKFIENDKCLYNYGLEYHIEYFQHMVKLHPSLTKQINTMSGISHHMMFEKKYISELFDLVEKNNNSKFWEVFLEQVDKSQVLHSGASEYEIYFNFLIKYHFSDIGIRYLNWNNTTVFPVTEDIDYVSWHWYLR